MIAPALNPLSLRLYRDMHGATAVEFALIAPLLFLLLFGAVEAGRLLFVQSALHHSVSAAARCASIDPGGCGSPARLAAKIEAGMAALSAPTRIDPDALVVVSAPCGLSIAASMPYQPLLLKFAIAAPMLRAQACARP